MKTNDYVDLAFFTDWSFYQNEKSGFLVPATREIAYKSRDDVFGIKIGLVHTEGGECTRTVLNDLTGYTVEFIPSGKNIDTSDWEYEIQGDMVVISVPLGYNCAPPVYIAVLPPEAGTNDCC